jgi:hypothetical protein
MVLNSGTYDEVHSQCGVEAQGEVALGDKVVEGFECSHGGISVCGDGFLLVPVTAEALCGVRKSPEI